MGNSASFLLKLIKTKSDLWQSSTISNMAANFKIYYGNLCIMIVFWNVRNILKNLLLLYFVDISTLFGRCVQSRYAKSLIKIHRISYLMSFTAWMEKGTSHNFTEVDTVQYLLHCWIFIIVRHFPIYDEQL